MLSEEIRLSKKEECEVSLKLFIEHYWHVLEPGRPLVDGRVIDAICEHLEAVTDNQIRKLLINVPPGTMKSSITNVFWPAWELGPMHRPWSRYVSVSYGHNLTRRDNRKCKALIKDPDFKKNWRDVRLSKDEQNIDKWSTTQGGFRLASSIGGMVLGERGDRVILDDPNNITRMEGLAEIEKVLKFMTETLPSRITDPETSAIIVIMQRLHERDASGHILACNLGFEHLMLPMFYEKDRHCTTKIGFSDWRKEEGELLWPERFTKRYLDEDFIPFVTSWGGDYAVAGQLQQRPVPREGAMFHYNNFEIIEHHQLPNGGVDARGWDLAATSKKQNPNACYTTGVRVKWHKGIWYITDVKRDRVPEYALEDFVYNTSVNDGRLVSLSIPQDPGAAGKVLKTAFIQRHAGFNIRSSPETGSKVNRAIPVAAQAEAGMIKLVKGPWNQAFLAEVAMFPNGAFTDQVDAMSRVFNHILKYKDELMELAMPEVIDIDDYRNTVEAMF